MSVQVRSGGWWLNDIAKSGELKWSHAAAGGCKDASFKMDLPPTYSHSALQRGKIVEIRHGSPNAWQGFIADIDVEDGWTVNCLGLSALGKDYLCFDSGMNTTSTPNTAIDQAIARGLPWTRPNTVSGIAFAAGDTTTQLNYLGDLLDAWGNSRGRRWGVNAAGEVYGADDPTTPTWYLTPGVGRFGLADDEYASHLFVRYLASGSGYATVAVSDPVAAAKFGRREYPVDATSRGIMSGTDAFDLGAGLLAKGKARQGYTNGVTVSKSQLITPGGTPACLPLVQAQQMVRAFGVPDEQGQTVPYVDWVIGETSLEAGSDQITLTPVGLVARTLGDVLDAAA